MAGAGGGGRAARGGGWRTHGDGNNPVGWLGRAFLGRKILILGVGGQELSPNVDWGRGVRHQRCPPAPQRGSDPGMVPPSLPALGEEEEEEEEVSLLRRGALEVLPFPAGCSRQIPL